MMRIRFLIVLIFSLLLFKSNGQSLLWENYFGWNWGDVVNSIEKVESNYYLAGYGRYEASIGANSPILIKVNADGDTLWTKNYRSTFLGNIQDIKVNHRNNLLLLAVTRDTANNVNHTGVAEVDTNGNLYWFKEYNTSVWAASDKLAVLPDGSSIFTGDRSGGGGNYPYAIRISHNGTVIWDKSFTNIPNAQGKHMVPMRNGGFVLSGRTGYLGDNQIYQIQIDINGDTISTGKVYTGVSDHDNWNGRVVQFSDGGFLVTGNVKSEYDSLFIAKYDSSFSKDWISYNNGLFISDLVEIEDGNILLIGEENVRGLLYKYNNQGTNTFKGRFKTMSGEFGLWWGAIEFDGVGNTVVAGSFDQGSPESDQFYYAKIDSVGIPLPLNHNCNPPTIHSLEATWNGDTVTLKDSSTVTLPYNQEVYRHWFFQEGSDSFFDTVSFVLPSDQYADSFWVALVVSDGIYCTDTVTINVYNNEVLPNYLGVKEKNKRKAQYEALRIYPNPATNEFKVLLPQHTHKCTLELYDAMGRMKHSEYRIQNSEAIVQTNVLSEGIYYVLVRDRNGEVIGKGKVILK